MPTLTRNSAVSSQEKRYVSLEGDTVTRTDDAIGFRGHAALFERRTWIGPPRLGFWEQVARGAFTKSVGEADVRFLVNHDPNLVLARTTSGTLRLSEDSVGLLADADLARTSYGDDLAISLERGDVTQMSFAFEVVREGWEVLGDETEMRTILEAKLWDVSAVTFPAYSDTDAALRSQAFDVLAVRLGLSTTRRSRLIAGLGHDDPDPEAFTILRDASTKLASLVDGSAPAPATPNPNGSTSAPADATRTVPLTVTRRRHQLVAARHGFDTNSSKENP